MRILLTCYEYKIYILTTLSIICELLTKEQVEDISENEAKVIEKRGSENS